MSGAAVASALQPTVGTVRPSARLPPVSVKTGWPAFMASVKLGHNTGSTPCKVRIPRKSGSRWEESDHCKNWQEFSFYCRSLKLTIIFTDGFIVFIALAIPASNPPPPTGTTTASTSGTCEEQKRPLNRLVSAQLSLYQPAPKSPVHRSLAQREYWDDQIRLCTSGLFACQ